MTSTFPTHGTWFSRWHQIYRQPPAAPDSTTPSTASALPRTSQFTTAA